MDLLDNYRYRPTVYVLAIIDIILSSISLSWSFLFVVAMCVAPETFATELAAASSNKHNRLYSRNSNSESYNINDPQQLQTNIQPIVAIVWTAIVVQILACVLQTVAAIKLLNASKPNINPTEALAQCRFWRFVTLFFTALMFFKLVFGSEGRSMLVFLFVMSNIILRLTCIRYVQLYMRELHVLHVPPALGGGFLPTHHITQAAVHPHAYYPGPIPMPMPKPPQMHMGHTSMDMPPSYEDCVKKPSYEECIKEPDIKQ